jgi:hypothetical protein
MPTRVGWDSTEKASVRGPALDSSGPDISYDDRSVGVDRDIKTALNLPRPTPLSAEGRDHSTVRVEYPDPLVSAIKHHEPPIRQHGQIDQRTTRVQLID